MSESYKELLATGNLRGLLGHVSQSTNSVVVADPLATRIRTAVLDLFERLVELFAELRAG